MAVPASLLASRLVDLFGNPDIADPTKLYGNLTVGPNGIVQIGTGLQMPDGFVTNLTAPGKNRVINGSFLVAQRPSVTAPPGALTYGGPDRFYAANRGNALGTFSQSSGTMTYNNVVRPCITQAVTVAGAATGFTSNAGAYWYGVTQFIEGVNCYDLLGQQVTVSFLFNTNVPGTYSVNLSVGANTPSNVQTFTVATAGVSYQSFTFPAIPLTANLGNTNTTGLRVSIGAISGTTFQAPSATQGQWVSGNVFTSAQNTIWSTTVGNFISVAELQVEVGSNVTPFERRLYGQELLMCQRYFVSDTIGFVGSAYQAGATVGGWYGFPTQMRATPTIAYISVPDNTNITGYTATVYNNRMIRMSGTGTAAGTVSYTANIYAYSEL